MTATDSRLHDPSEPQPIATGLFALTVPSERVRDGIRTTWVHVADRYAHPRHRLARRAVHGFLGMLERYLRARPHLTPDSPRNPVRSLLYFPPGVKEWAGHMPGSFATSAVHDPEAPLVRSGRRLDPVTRSFFRHSADGMGLRSRAYAMAWLVQQRHRGRDAPARWLSLGAGTGRPTLEAARLLPRGAVLLLTDIDEDALGFARGLAEREARPPLVHAQRLDALDSEQVQAVISEMKPDVIDAMGLVEYLDDAQLVELVRAVRSAAPEGTQFIFTNMLPTHPELQVHRRGLGWPGVVLRDVEKVCALLRQAGTPAESIRVVLPDDGVYGVYELMA